MAEKSFANYALGFARLLVSRRQSYYTGSSPPLNILVLCFEAYKAFWLLVAALVPDKIEPRFITRLAKPEQPVR